MPDLPPIDDDEIILRHIPGGTTFQAPGPRITSVNFRPRKVIGETDISVNRLRLTSPEQLLILAHGDPAKGSRITWTTAAAIRALGVAVVPSPIEPHDPGHASLQSTDAADLENQSVQRALSKLFQFVDAEHPLSAPPSQVNL